MSNSAVRRRIGLIAAIILMLSAAGFLGGLLVRGALAAESGYSEFAKAMEVIRIVSAVFYKPVSVSQLSKAYLETRSIQEMLKTLNDPYTRYMDPKDFKQMKETTQGAFGGIGIVVGIRDNRVTVISPIEGTPGERAGLRSGDQIMKIDGTPTDDMALDQAVSLMKGEPGTKVTLTIKRQGSDKLIEVPIVRDIIKAPAASGEMIDKEYGIGYIDLAVFSEHAGADLEKELRKLESQGMKALVLDFRYNGGGLLNQAVEVASKFMPKGPVVHVVDRDGKKRTYYTVGTGYRDIPLVILVNEWTASASEIVAGTLQDLGRAVLVGTETFGKGLVQTIYELGDGSGLAVTTQRYQTAGGRFIDPEHRIKPDYVVEMKAPEEGSSQEDFVDVQLEKALEILRARLDAAKTQNLKKAG